MIDVDNLLKTCDLFVKIASKAEHRGDVVFPSTNKNVKDNKDHFPINSAAQARNALSRANQYTSAPEWYSGSLQSLLNTLTKAVKNKYPSINVSEKSTNPGKN